MNIEKIVLNNRIFVYLVANYLCSKAIDSYICDSANCIGVEGLTSRVRADERCVWLRKMQQKHCENPKG